MKGMIKIKPIVYADVLFLVNFMINLILLKITSSILKRRISNTRLCSAAALGAVYAVCMFFPRISILYIFPFKIAISALMVKIITPKCGMLRFIKSTAIFFLVSFTFAGVLLALIYFAGAGAENATFISNGIFYFNLSLNTLIFACAISYAIIAISSAFFRRSKVLGIKKLKISLKGKECEITAMSDTGNLLCDPISRNPVVIAERDYLKDLFPDGVPDYCEPRETDGIKLRLIPYTSLGKTNGILTGFVPDSITIDGCKTKEAIVAIAENVLSPSDEYNALFNPNIII